MHKEAKRAERKEKRDTDRKERREDRENRNALEIEKFKLMLTALTKKNS